MREGDIQWRKKHETSLWLHEIVSVTQRDCMQSGLSEADVVFVATIYLHKNCTVTDQKWTWLGMKMCYAEP